MYPPSAHLVCTSDGPCSAYSAREIPYTVLRAESAPMVEPPIHAAYLRSGGAMTLILIDEGARA